MNTLCMLRALARPFRHTTVALAAAALLVTGIVMPASAKDKKQDEAKQPESRRFFSFDDAPYYTSPDKRIGVKLLVDSAKVGPTLAALQHLTMLPTAHIKSHRHVYVTEIIHVLKGSLTLRIEKEVKVMGANAVAYIPPQTFHEYLNDSGDVVEFLQYFSPSGPEEEYRNWERPDVPKPVIQSKTGPASPTEIVRPSLPPIPGSPRVLVGTVQESATEPAAPESAIATLAAPVPVTAEPAPAKPAKMEFKLKNKKRTVSLETPTATATKGLSVGTPR
ncbi:MAG TPA: cupin domain-containing protein [Candidatus Ozemobacteraceae bacterium]